MWTQKEKTMVYEKIFAIRKIMIAHGFPVREIVNVKYSKAITTYGKCRKNKDNTVTITISEITIRDNSLINTIVHELCHAIDVENNYQHNHIWKQLANDVGKLFNENIVRCAEISKEYIEEKRNRCNYIIKCEHCGKEYYYMRKTKTIKTISQGNKRRYYCTKCGSHDLKVYDYGEQK